MLLYGLSEGVGSGCLPMDAPQIPTASMTSTLHNTFGGVADFVMFGFPFVVLLLFSKNNHY
jgi:hypothetical protein